MIIWLPKHYQYLNFAATFFAYFFKWPSPVDCMREATFTVSPNRQYLKQNFTRLLQTPECVKEQKASINRFAISWLVFVTWKSTEKLLVVLVKMFIIYCMGFDFECPIHSFKPLHCMKDKMTRNDIVRLWEILVFILMIPDQIRFLS